jgi:Flp pilus assembly protein TadG
MRWKPFARLGDRARDESGAVAVIFAVMMVVMLGVAALAIDLGSFYQAQRQAQSAADAAALAGAADLPSSASSATTDATSYVNQNDPGATETISTPYLSNSQDIKVTVNKTVPSFFGALLGLSSTVVTASAAAGASSGSTPTAVFAYNTACSGGSPGITFPGSSITITGGTHSNGFMTIPGSSNTLSTTTYGGPNGCTFSNPGGSSNTFGGSANPTVDSKTEPWPYDYTKDTPACTFSGSSFSWNTDGATIPSGVYCATSQITINASRLSGTVSLIAPKISLSGSFDTLTPYYHGLSMYQTGTNDMQLNGSSETFGTVFAPNATIKLTGSSGTITGFFEGLNISISGSSWTLAGNGPALAGSGEALIQ